MARGNKKAPPSPKLVLERGPEGGGRRQQRRANGTARRRYFFNVLLGAATIFFASILGSGLSADVSDVPPRKHEANVRGLRAVVVGATGATGRQVVRALLASERWAQVTAVTRREPQAGELHAESEPPAKLRVVWTSEQLDDAASWRGDVLFNCIGTTRSKAGGGGGFKLAEVNASATAARRALDAGVRHASLVSAVGANARIWVDPWELVHPLLYARTLGQKELAMRGAQPSGGGAGFASLSIFRPGMLDRLMGDRIHEVLINALGIGLRVDALAGAMVLDAEAQVAAAGGARADEAAPNEVAATSAAATPVYYAGNPMIATWSNEAAWRRGRAGTSGATAKS